MQTLVNRLTGTSAPLKLWPYGAIQICLLLLLLSLARYDTALVLQQNRLWRYGHVLRKDDDWVKKCMEYEVEGPRPRKRPKRTWREVVETDCQARKLNTEDAMDRSRWRKLIKDVWWSGWVWLGEFFFWYRPTRVVPDKGPLNGCVCVISTAMQAAYNTDSRSMSPLKSVRAESLSCTVGPHWAADNCPSTAATPSSCRRNSRAQSATDRCRPRGVDISAATEARRLAGW